MASSFSLGWREPSIPADELEAAVRSRAIRGVSKYVASALTPQRKADRHTPRHSQTPKLIPALRYISRISLTTKAISGDLSP